MIIGVPTGLGMVLPTSPYYRSTYVFVTRRDRRINVRSFDDPILRRVRIGVQLIGDDGTNSPPAHALSNRGIIYNVKGYAVYGDYSQESPPSRIIDAVARGDVDVAIAWGPMAGYWAKRSPIPLKLVPVQPQIDLPFLPFVFDIGMGVRHGDTTFRASLQSVLTRRRPEIRRILDEYRLIVGEYGLTEIDATATIGEQQRIVREMMDETLADYQPPTSAGSLA